MSSSLKPMAIVTTIQPMLVLWLLAISFFVTIALVAVLSKGRKWYELACMFLLAFVVSSAASVGVATLILDVRVVDVEVISLRNS